MWFLNQKRADQVASSIAQFIPTLAVGREHDGQIGPERLLVGLPLLIGLAGKAKFFVSLATAPDHSSHRLTIDGRGVYSGFSLACALPPRTVMSDLRPSAVGHQARLLYAACKTMPNVVERRDFR